MLHLSLLQLAFEENLERHDVLGLLLSGQVHVPKLALPQGPPNVKVI